MWHNILTWAGQANVFANGGSMGTGIQWIIPGRRSTTENLQLSVGMVTDG